jgi:acyl-CoA thioesterase-2
VAQEDPLQESLDPVDELCDALVVRPAGPDRFHAPSPTWWEGDRVFGGLLVAQVLNGAIQTVDEFRPHSLHAYFLRPVPPGVNGELRVARVRDGRSFATREVDMEVDGKLVVRALCSFCSDEDGDLYQLTMPECEEPDDLLPEDSPFPFEMRELGPTQRRSDGTYEATRRVWMRTRSRLPDDSGIHATLLAYLSDMTGASFRPHSLGSWGGHTDASLDHALWFHRPFRADEWVLYDLVAIVNAGGRATVRGAMFTREGELCLSMTQELLIRPLENPVIETNAAWATGPERIDPRSL